MPTQLNYISAYPQDLQRQVQDLLEADRLRDHLLARRADAANPVRRRPKRIAGPRG